MTEQETRIECVRHASQIMSNRHGTANDVMALAETIYKFVTTPPSAPAAEAPDAER